jgi:two-component system nitrate/nitrite response regulator NarL
MIHQLSGTGPEGEGTVDPPGKTRLRLAILDDYGLFRASLARFLSAESDIEVAGDFGTSADALESLAREAGNGSPIDLVLLGFDVSPEHGNDFISAARQAGYQGRFLILAGSADLQSSALALKLGVSGIFLKSEAPDRLVQAIRLIGNDGIWVDKRIIQMLADQLIDRYPRPDDAKSIGSLQGIERDVLLGIVEGHTNRKIGESLGMSESKVKNTVQRLFGRAGVKTRGQLVRAALEGSLGVADEISRRHHLS